jgi:hypothetical protein
LLTCNDIALFINVQFQDKTIVSKLLTGDVLLPLLQHGTVTLPLEERLFLGDCIPQIYSDEEEDDNNSDGGAMNDACYDPAYDLGLQDFCASMHLLQVADKKMHCIFHADEVTSCNSCTSDGLGFVDVDATIKTQVFPLDFLTKGPGCLPLKRSATPLLRHLFHSKCKNWPPLSVENWVQGSHESGLLPDVRFEVSLLPHAVPAQQDPTNPSLVGPAPKLDPVSKRLLISTEEVCIGVVLESNGPFHMFDSCVFNSTREAEQHGVTLLHLLDHVDWNNDED